jgi:hypothetical protein
MVSQLNGDHGLSRVPSLPQTLRHGTLHGYAVLPSMPQERPSAPARRHLRACTAAIAISDLHRMTSSTATINNPHEGMGRCSDPAVATNSHLNGEEPGLDQLKEALYSALLGSMPPRRVSTVTTGSATY